MYASSLTTPPLWPPKHEYNAVSLIADGIWQYRTGGNLTIFDKDHSTAEEGLLQVRQKYSLYELRCPPPLCARATHTAISVITSQVHYPA